MSTVKVNTISTWTGSDISIETGKTVSGTASQFKMTDVVQGDVLYGAAADTLSRLAPGTAGQILQTQGAGANPVWAASGTIVKRAVICEQQASGVSGGTATSGSWQIKTLNTETPMVIIAGCVFCVSFNSVSGPFNISSESEKPKVLSTVSKILLTDSNRS